MMWLATDHRNERSKITHIRMRTHVLAVLAAMLTSSLTHGQVAVSCPDCNLPTSAAPECYRATRLPCVIYSLNQRFEFAAPTAFTPSNPFILSTVCCDSEIGCQSAISVTFSTTFTTTATLSWSSTIKVQAGAGPYGGVSSAVTAGSSFSVSRSITSSYTYTAPTGVPDRIRSNYFFERSTPMRAVAIARTKKGLLLTGTCPPEIAGQFEYLCGTSTTTALGNWVNRLEFRSVIVESNCDCYDYGTQEIIPGCLIIPGAPE